MKKTMWGAMALAVVVAILVGTAAWAQEPTPPSAPAAGPRAVITGQVTAISGQAITVLSLRGEQVRVQTDDRTNFRTKIDGGAASLADIHVGNAIVARGQWAEQNVMLARGVALVPEKVRNARRVRGEITAVTGSGFTLDTLEGPMTVAVDGDTRFLIPRAAQPGLDDLQVGDAVVVRGQEADGTVQAKLVRSAINVRKLARTVVRGEVTAVDGTSITLNAARGTVTVATSADTTYWRPDASSFGPGDIKVGDKVLALGQMDDGGQFNARIVVQLRATKSTKAELIDEEWLDFEDMP